MANSGAVRNASLNFGGKDSEGDDMCSVSIFNLETNTHRNGPPMPSTHAEFAAILLDDKIILISGGRLGREGLNTTEIFDIVSETFFAGPELEMARYGHANVMTLKNQVLLVGGIMQWHDGEEEEESCTS
jgi:hypothetical protein